MIPSLGPGGAERVMTLLAGALAARGHEVSLLTLTDPREDFFSIDSRIRRVGLGLTSESSSALAALRANVRRVRAIRRVVADTAPDAVLSFITSMNVLAVLACIGSRSNIVISERIDPSSHRPEKLWAVLRAIVYPRADTLVVQTRQAADWFRARLRRTQVTTIPNPVQAETRLTAANLQVAGPYVLAAGRLAHQKGFDILIHAFASVVRKHAGLRLVIAGEGPEAAALQRLVTQLELGAHVLFPGVVQPLAALMHGASVFVLASRYEGFPNVLLEALANSVAVVATDCPGGPREILEDGNCGILVPCEDAAALADAIDRVVQDPGLRERLADAGSKAATSYGLDTIVAQWERVLVRT